MKFAELREYIDTRRKKLLERASFPSSGPTSQSEFLELCDLLDKMSKEAPPRCIEELPDKPKPPGRFPDFIASDDLQSLESKLLEFTRALEALDDKPNTTSRSRRKLKQKIEFISRDIAQLRHEEMIAYTALRDAHYRPYGLANGKYRAAERAYEEKLQKHDQDCQRIRETRVRIAHRVRRDVVSAFSSDRAVRVQRLRWHVLASGEWTPGSILKHFRELKRLFPKFEYDVNRIDSMLSLDPSICYLGLDEFEGYIVFEFAYTNMVVMDCPLYGNAIYIVDGNWKELSQLSKLDLRTNYHSQIVRIVHRGDWLSRIEGILR